jgi:glycosyltransferase involved in cell wall biosynthesis
MDRGRKLRIAVDCRIEDPRQGTGMAVLSLAKALSESKSADQEYTFLVTEENRNWLAPYIYGPCKVVGIPATGLRSIKLLRSIWHRLRGNAVSVPRSDGFIESHQFDVVHFPTQLAFLTDLPSIYQPWDLQHLHYPEFFSREQFAAREVQYRAFCGQATFVCVQAEWTKSDVITQFGIEAEKIRVIPWGSVFDSYEMPSTKIRQATIEKFGFPRSFFFYPAATWPHKNHEVILRALYILKTVHGRAIDVYFTGASKEHRPVLDRLVEELGISKQVHFLGFLAPEELQVVFSTATAMVFPSKFEGFGLPILEAFHASLPVLSSDATTLPEVAQDAALYFDPDAPEELAKLMLTMLDMPELRQNLIRRGTDVLSRCSMSETVAKLQALYEQTAALASGGPILQHLTSTGGKELDA